uniref:Uncharacterized protein n=1 Tax=Haplochromis burtoni TaxID=8153 RepID=A0A3Q2VII1_HAPBU
MPRACGWKISPDHHPSTTMLDSWNEEEKLQFLYWPLEGDSKRDSHVNMPNFTAVGSDWGLLGLSYYFEPLNWISLLFGYILLQVNAQTERCLRNATVCVIKSSCG